MGIFSGFKRILNASNVKSMVQRLFDDEPPPANVRISYGDDPLQFADLRLPKDAGDAPYPIVIVLHGGFWKSKYTLDHIGHLSAALTSNGVATYSIEYRKIGDQDGGWPNTMLDVGKASDHLRSIAEEYNLDLERIVVTGHSAGGHLAAWIAARHNIPEGDPLYMEDPLIVDACVPLAGVVDLNLCWKMRLSNGIVEQLMGGTPSQMPERYETASPGSLLPLGVKQRLIHGTADPNVPYEIANLYVARAKNLGDDIELITLKGTGHFEVIDPLSKEYPIVRDTILNSLPQ